MNQNDNTGHNLTVDRSKEMDERSWWDFWNTSYRAEDNRDQTSNEMFAHVVALMQNLTHDNGGRILEVGCGTGTLSRQLSFSNYYGIDISAAAIEIARQKAERLQLPSDVSRPVYEAIDFHEWLLPSPPFDIVTCVDAIEGFRDQRFVLRKMAEAVRSGGAVLLLAVNPIVYNRIRRVGGVKLENGPISHWMSRGELHNLVREAGLALEQSYTIMPRGNMGMLRIINGRRLSQLFGERGAPFLRQAKERAGLGQYRIVVARKK